MLLIFSLLVLSTAAPTLKTLFKISSRTHPSSLVSSLLLSKYRQIGSGTNLSKALALAASGTCSENTCFRYVLESARLAQLTVPASECRLNRDDSYQTVILPSSHIQDHFDEDDIVNLELKNKLRLYLLEVLGLVFSDFADLDYGLQCYGDHYELTQVVLQQTIVVANLKLHVSVPTECSFSQFASHIGNEYTSLVEIELPVNGTFVCTSGRSAHCNMRNAIDTFPKLRSRPF